MSRTQEEVDAYFTGSLHTVESIIEMFLESAEEQGMDIKTAVIRVQLLIELLENVKDDIAEGQSFMGVMKGSDLA